MFAKTRKRPRNLKQSTTKDDDDCDDDEVSVHETRQLLKELRSQPLRPKQKSGSTMTKQADLIEDDTAGLILSSKQHLEKYINQHMSGKQQQLPIRDSALDSDLFLGLPRELTRDPMLDRHKREVEKIDGDAERSSQLLRTIPEVKLNRKQ
jgi:hypothetical protein